MTQTADIDALIARLEDATGPDRELDALLAVASGQFCHIYRTVAGCFVYRADEQGGQRAPYFTASIDAALMLVPEGCFPSLAKNVRSGVWRAWVATVSCDKWNRPKYNTKDAAEAPTPALAICIASLRVKQEQSS